MHSFGVVIHAGTAAPRWSALARCPSTLALRYPSNCQLRQRLEIEGLPPGMDRGCRAADNAAHDAVMNGRQSEEVEGEVKLVVWDGPAAGASAVIANVVAFRWNAERLQVGPGQT